MKILMICTGNICRSPTAEGVFRALAEREGLLVQVDSAGTHDYHAGEPPDPRATAHASRRGYDLSALRARQVVRRDFDEFDLILAMDRGHLRTLQQLCPPQSRHKLRLLMEFAPGRDGDDVPDPYYGDPTQFEQVLDMVEAAASGLLSHLRVSI